MQKCKLYMLIMLCHCNEPYYAATVLMQHVVCLLTC